MYIPIGLDQWQSCPPRSPAFIRNVRLLRSWLGRSSVHLRRAIDLLSTVWPHFCASGLPRRLVGFAGYPGRLASACVRVPHPGSSGRTLHSSQRGAIYRPPRGCGDTMWWSASTPLRSRSRRAVDDVSHALLSSILIPVSASRLSRRVAVCGLCGLLRRG
ncbi:hypothetical protein OH77DRAFT_1297767 [Trametes cingulata]|nr:hypothetical protein OH77DRAFT_1297767 [Trametes cingulata]